jgi:signal transduction histidine kinase
MMSEIKYKANIMVVDDTPMNLHLLEDMLGKQGYDVRPLPRGALALRAAANDPPDLILLDIMMPDMNGYQVCEKLKQDEKLKEIPVIFISAHTESLDKVKAFRVGGIDYVSKPFQFEEVLARVETHLKLRRYHVELELRNERLNQTLDDLKDAQSQLVQSEKMVSLGMLTAGIAHEINNPVNYINASAKALKMKLRSVLELLEHIELTDSQDAGQGMERILAFKAAINTTALRSAINELTTNISSGAERTAEIIRGLRTFSRLDEEDLKTADIHENIDSTLILLHNQYKNSITIQKEYGDIPCIECYPGKLNQMFMNILKNAIDAIKEKRIKTDNESIRIKTSVTGHAKDRLVSIEITDTGPGITEKVRARLFEPFFTTKAVGKGTGLGLSITKRIIHDHNGSVEVESKPDQGAAFKILIPLNPLTTD